MAQREWPNEALIPVDRLRILLRIERRYLWLCGYVQREGHFPSWIIPNAQAMETALDEECTARQTEQGGGEMIS